MDKFILKPGQSSAKPSNIDQVEKRSREVENVSTYIIKIF